MTLLARAHEYHLVMIGHQSNKSDVCVLGTGQTRRSDMESNRQENLVSKCVIIDCDTDVTHLHLAKRGLTSVPDLSRFCMLRCVWLSNNKIREVTRASFNCRLTELYLQNNDILSISGALRHLTCLRVLLLFNNQIKCLEETVAELKNMQELHTLSLYLNPFTEDPEYHLYVLHHLPSVQFLDTKEVQQVERRRALKLFNVERQKVLDSIAFGRRALPPPIGRKTTNTITKPVGQHVSRKSTDRSDLQNCSEAKSITQFSIMNWTSTNTSQWNHLEVSSRPESDMLTVKLR